MDAKKGNGLDAPHDQPAKILTKRSADFIPANRFNGTFPKRHNTVTAEVLCRLCTGESLTGMEAVLGCSTTRLAATIHYLSSKYDWNIDRVDIDVGTNDGRIVVIRTYFLQRAAIRRAFDDGAFEFCRSVKAARAKTRKQAPKAKAEADKRNAARIAARFNPHQNSLFAGSELNG
jgi:hypothetical protein